MSENVVFNIDSSLFFWVVIAYFIILYHSFDIKEVQEKIHGIEVLFVSVALGTFLSLVYEYLLLPSFELLRQWFIGLKTVNQLPFTFDPFHRSLHEPFTTQMEYYAIGFFFFILFIYFLSIYSSALIIWIFHKILDPSTVIFSKYRRFAIFTENKIPEILLYSIPRLFSTIGVSILVIGSIVGHLLNITEIDSGFRGGVQVLLGLSSLGLMIVMLILFVHVTKYDLKLIYQLLKKISSKIAEIRNRNLKKQKEDPEKRKFDKIIDKYINVTIYIMIFFLISISINDYLEKQISFAEMVLGLFSTIIMIAMVYIAKYRNNRV